jgi:hypothetical protein
MDKDHSRQRTETVEALEPCRSCAISLLALVLASRTQPEETAAQGRVDAKSDAKAVAEGICEG